MRGRAPDKATGDAADALSRLGYAAELRRAMGGFSSFALSFSIISVLTGVTSVYGDALRAGGPAGVGLGWPLVSAGTVLVAVAMAELASAFPTAGALYHWAALLGGARFGWFTAMMNLLGLVAVAGAIDLACAQALAGILGLTSPLAPYALFAAVLASHALINVGSVRLIAVLNDASAAVHIAGVAVLVVALLAVGRAQGVSYLAYTGAAGRAHGAPSMYALGFVSSLVLGMWTFTGFDASAHVAEETKDAARRAPRGIVSAVVVSAVSGYALIVALTLGIRSLAGVRGDANPVLYILRDALSDAWGRGAMGLVALAMWFAGLSSVTSGSRMLFAFARDGGVPFSARLRVVSPRWRTPTAAVLACSGAAGALTFAVAPLSDAVFVAVATLSTIAFYVSYALPIALGALARRRTEAGGAPRWRHLGPWNVGRFGTPIAWCAVVWCVFVVFVCVFTTPLAGALLAASTVTLAVLWLAVARARFAGPRVTLAAFEARSDSRGAGDVSAGDARTADRSPGTG